MASKPRFGTGRATGTTVRSAHPFGVGKAATQLISYEMRTDERMRRFLRDAKSGRIKSQAARVVNAGHNEMGRIVQLNVLEALQESMKSHPVKRPGREKRQLRRALGGWYNDHDPPWHIYGHNTMRPGVSLNWAPWLDKHVTDEKGRPYWRSVEFGFTLQAHGHMFMSRSGRISGPSGMTGKAFSMTGGRDPRMPVIAGAETNFIYKFAGYGFLRRGTAAGQREITRMGHGIYAQFAYYLPSELRRVMEFYAGGGRGRVRRPGGGFAKDPRSARPDD